MRISDWSSDVCSSALARFLRRILELLIGIGRGRQAVLRRQRQRQRADQTEKDQPQRPFIASSFATISGTCSARITPWICLRIIPLPSIRKHYGTHDALGSASCGASDGRYGYISGAT